MCTFDHLKQNNRLLTCPKLLDPYVILLLRTYLNCMDDIDMLVYDVPVDTCLSLVGLAQYSGDPRIEWHLNAYTTKDTVIDAVKNLPYKGGNTLTGRHLSSSFGVLFISKAVSRVAFPQRNSC